MTPIEYTYFIILFVFWLVLVIVGADSRAGQKVLLSEIVELKIRLEDYNLRVARVELKANKLETSIGEINE